MHWMNLRIGQRLAAGFGGMLAAFAALAAVATLRIGALSDEIGLMAGARYEQTVLAGRIRSDLNEVSRNMVNTLVMTDPGQVKKELDNLGRVLKSSEASLATLNQLITDEAGKALLAEIATQRAKFLPAQADFTRLVAEDNKDDALVKYQFAIRPTQARYFAALDKFVEQQHAQMQAAGADSVAQAQRTGVVIQVVAAVASALGLVVAWLATRSITRPLVRAVSVAQRVAAGDLSSRIEVRSRDETGQLMAALQEMNTGLQGLVGQVRQGTESITSASAEIASGNQDLSARTESQAAALQRTAGAILELTDSVQRNAGHARQADTLAQSASDVARQGGDAVAQVVRTMGAIDSSSRRIADIIGVIDGIAFQTNILALNAAVEAARAGEQGRGFAVVASEVRSLAQRSAGAAKEIRALIQASVDQVSAGNQLVQQAGNTMGEVVASVQRVTAIIGEITAAGELQSHGIQEVNLSIGQVDAATQQNAALVEQAAAAAESLKSQACQLERTVSVFKLQADAAV